MRFWLLDTAGPSPRPPSALRRIAPGGKRLDEDPARGEVVIGLLLLSEAFPAPTLHCLGFGGASLLDSQRSLVRSPRGSARRPS
jgi:hypothetical protein